jgi:hypothetical protein
MLIRENLLRNMIKQALTQKLLRETAEETIDFGEEEGSSYEVGKKLDGDSYQKLSTVLSNIISFNGKDSKKGGILILQMIYSLVNFVFSNKDESIQKDIIGIIKEPAGSNDNLSNELLGTIFYQFIPRLCREIQGKNSNDIHGIISKQMRALFIALGLRYYNHDPKKNEKDVEDKTGTQIGLANKKNAILHLLNVIKKDKIFEKIVDDIFGYFESETNNETAVENSNEPAGNQQQKVNSTPKNSVNDDDYDLRDDNDIGMDSKLPNATDAKNSKKSQWPKTFLKPRTERTPVEIIIRNQEGGQYSTPIEQIFENLFERNMRWSDQKQEFIMHLVGYGKVLSGDTWQKYSQYIPEIQNKLIALINNLLIRYREANTEPASKKRFELIQKEIREITINMFNSMQKGVEEKAKTAETDRRQKDSAAINNILKMKRSQMSSNSKLF